MPITLTKEQPAAVEKHDPIRKMEKFFKSEDKLETALKMLVDGLLIATTSKYTGLPISEIKAPQNKG
jgi:hypothetical protein